MGDWWRVLGGNECAWLGYGKVAWGTPFLFWDSSEKVFPWAMPGGTEIGPWTKCSDFQPMICESKWGWGWGRGERGFWPHIRAAIFPRSSEGQQITLGSHWLSWCLILSRPCPLCSPSSPQPSSPLHGSLCSSRLPDLVPPPSTHWNPAHPFRAHLYMLYSIQV